jgi:citrate lyase beta subunit
LRDAVLLKAAGKMVHVRVNGLDTGLTRDDLAAAIGPGLDGLVFPKAEGARDIRQLDVMIREQEMRNNVTPGTVQLFPHVESARGVLRCEEVAQASSRIAGMSLGGEDYVASLGVPRTGEALSTAVASSSTSAALWSAAARRGLSCDQRRTWTQSGD